MPITFSTPIPIDKWVFAHNNIIVEFSSDYVEEPLFCDVTVTGITPIRLYPLPSNDFWTNLKEYIASLINDYADDISYEIIPGNINSFVKDWDKILYNSLITFLISLTLSLFSRSFQSRLAKFCKTLILIEVRTSFFSKALTTSIVP